MFKLDEIRTYEILFLVSPFQHGCDLEIKVSKISIKWKTQQSEPLCKVCHILLKLCPRKGKYYFFCFKPIITKPDSVQQDWVHAYKSLVRLQFCTEMKNVFPVSQRWKSWEEEEGRAEWESTGALQQKQSCDMPKNRRRHQHLTTYFASTSAAAA